MSTINPADLGLVYLASPYAKYDTGIYRAFVDACKLSAQLMMSGVKCYSPIALGHSIAMHGAINPLDHSFWLPFDMAMMNAADTLVVAHMPGWEESYGIGEEIKFFEASGKPIYDIDPATLVMTRRPTSGLPDLHELRRVLTRGKANRSPRYECAMARVERLDSEIANYAHNKTPSQQGGSSA